MKTTVINVLSDWCSKGKSRNWAVFQEPSDNRVFIEMRQGGRAIRRNFPMDKIIASNFDLLGHEVDLMAALLAKGE